MAEVISPSAAKPAHGATEKVASPFARGEASVGQEAAGGRADVPGAALPPASVHRVRSVPDAVGAVCGDILANGMEYVSSERSMNAGRPIREILNCTVVLTEPRERATGGFKVSPGLAAARTLYLFSGSNALANIEYYTRGVRRFSEDGITLPGSAYGHRIFGGARGHANLFERAAAVAESRANSKRASIPIFWPHDTEAAAETVDLPCAFGIHFSLRDAGLISTVTMRANDALKILPYNLFEFSLLGECMAARLGAPHVAHVHSSVSMHLRDEGIAAGKALLAERSTPRVTLRVGRFDEGVRRSLADAENALRRLGRGAKPDEVLRLLPAACEGGPWRDLLLAAALLAAEAEGLGEAACQSAQRLIAAEAEAFPVSALEIARQLCS